MSRVTATTLVLTWVIASVPIALLIAYAFRRFSHEMVRIERDHADEINRISRHADLVCPACRGMVHELDIARAVIARQTVLVSEADRALTEATAVVHRVLGSDAR